MIIDSHVYLIPDRIIAESEIFTFDESIRSSIFKHPDSKTALGLCNANAILDSMDSSDIEKSVLVSFPWDTEYLCQMNNEFILEQAAMNDRFIPVCSINPFSKNSGYLVEGLLNSGAIGIKMNPNWQKFGLNCSSLVEIFEVISVRGSFLMLHVDQAYKNGLASAAFLYELATRFPSLKILAAHMGGMLGAYSRLPNFSAAIKNIWFDTAVSASLHMVKYYIDLGLEEKVIFGSDYPFNHSHSQLQLINDINELDLTPANLSNIYEKNLYRMLTADISKLKA